MVQINETVVNDEELSNTYICLAEGSEVNSETAVKALPGGEELAVHKAAEDGGKDGLEYIPVYPMLSGQRAS